MRKTYLAAIAFSFFEVSLSPRKRLILPTGCLAFHEFGVPARKLLTLLLPLTASIAPVDERAGKQPASLQGWERAQSPLKLPPSTALRIAVVASQHNSSQSEDAKDRLTVIKRLFATCPFSLRRGRTQSVCENCQRKVSLEILIKPTKPVLGVTSRDRLLSNACCCRPRRIKPTPPSSSIPPQSNHRINSCCSSRRHVTRYQHH